MNERFYLVGAIWCYVIAILEAVVQGEKVSRLFVGIMVILGIVLSAVWAVRG